MDFSRMEILQIVSCLFTQLFRCWVKFKIAKTGLASLKIKTDFTDRPITVFCNNDISDIFSFGFLVILIVSINKHNDIRVLLNAVMRHNIICNKVMLLIDSKIKNFSFSIWLDGNDLVPVHVALC